MCALTKDDMVTTYAARWLRLCIESHLLHGVGLNTWLLLSSFWDASSVVVDLQFIPIIIA